MTTRNERFCNCSAQRNGLDPGGYAGHFQDAIVVETPLPWQRSPYDGDWLPQELRDLLQIWQQEYEATGEYPHRPLMVAPDDVYSQDGYRRCIFYTQPDGLFAVYDQTEYFVPEAEIGALVWTWYQSPDTLDQFDDYRVDHSHDVRDILVCTHGTVDAACAKFGYPLYKHLRETHADDALRVWRVSHFGGHVFAPTLMDMPTGHYWAYIDTKAKARHIVERTGDVQSLAGHYRGWAGMPGGFMQAAERDLWQQHGWQWFAYRKTGEIIAQDTGDTPQWADVRIQHISPESKSPFVHTCRVETTSPIETRPASGDERTRLYTQYQMPDRV